MILLYSNTITVLLPSLSPIQTILEVTMENVWAPISHIILNGNDLICASCRSKKCHYLRRGCLFFRLSKFICLFFGRNGLFTINYDLSYQFSTMFVWQKRYWQILSFFHWQYRFHFLFLHFLVLKNLVPENVFSYLIPLFFLLCFQDRLFPQIGKLAFYGQSWNDQSVTNICG